MYQHYQEMEQARADAQKHATRALRAARYTSWLFFAGVFVWLMIGLLAASTMLLRFSR